MRLALAVVTSMLFLAACGGTGQATIVASTSTAAQQANPTLQVTYKITRSNANIAGEASVTYTNEQGGTEQTTAKFATWDKTFTMARGSSAYLSVQNPADNGGVTCEIMVNGASFKRSQSDGPYVIATCSGVIGS